MKIRRQMPFIWEEFKKYTSENTINQYEHKSLRDWVCSRHSVNETVESRYLPGPAYPPMDFMAACQLDRELLKTKIRQHYKSDRKSMTGYNTSSTKAFLRSNKRRRQARAGPMGAWTRAVLTPNGRIRTNVCFFHR